MTKDGDGGAIRRTVPGQRGALTVAPEAKPPAAGSTFVRGMALLVCLHSHSMQRDVENLPVDPLRLLVADDHPVVRAGMVALLEREGDLRVVFQAGHGAEAVAGWGAHAPNVGLIDLSMPVLDGFGAVAAIRRIDPEARLVVMTTVCGDEDVYRALQAGASGYLLKDCGQQELVDCIRAVAIGRKYLHATASARLADCALREQATGNGDRDVTWHADGDDIACLEREQLAKRQFRPCKD